jgi:hypothetical protein
VDTTERSAYHRRMVKKQEPKTKPELEPFERFQRMARALFQVDKRDVPKHEPVKRTAKRTTAR